jgi:hypothetical protein
MEAAKRKLLTLAFVIDRSVNPNRLLLGACVELSVSISLGRKSWMACDSVAIGVRGVLWSEAGELCVAVSHA